MKSSQEIYSSILAWLYENHEAYPDGKQWRKAFIDMLKDELGLSAITVQEEQAVIQNIVTFDIVKQYGDAVALLEKYNLPTKEKPTLEEVKTAHEKLSSELKQVIANMKEPVLQLIPPIAFKVLEETLIKRDGDIYMDSAFQIKEPKKWQVFITEGICELDAFVPTATIGENIEKWKLRQPEGVNFPSFHSYALLQLKGPIDELYYSILDCDASRLVAFAGFGSYRRRVRFGARGPDVEGDNLRGRASVQVL